MSTRLCRTGSALVVLGSVLFLASSAKAAWGSFNYGSGSVDMFTPKSPGSSPGLVVALHYCSGNSSNAHGWLDSAADQNGWYQIAPQAGGNCFDAAPGRSGERAKIASMVDAMITKYSIDPTKVFSVGASSGACMTQALLASYPDKFSAGASLAGVPVGAWNGGNAYGWSTSGVSGGAAWGDKVRSADPGFSGSRPRVQLWQGQGDTTLTYSQAYPAEVAQWMNVFGVTDADGTKSSTKPTGAQDTWERTSYKDKSGVVVLEANSGPSNVPHDLTGRGLWGDVARFFLAGSSTQPGPDAGATGGNSGGTGGIGGGSTGGVGGGRDAGLGARDGASTGSDGGAGNGGAIGSGGAAASGGTVGSGGAVASGGSTAHTSGTGGAVGSGGAAKGGSSGAGGTPGAGGSSANGGSSASGGASASNGGSNGNGGSTATSDGDSSGCGCVLGARAKGMGQALALLLVGAALLARRKRASR
jgi:poly(hydroxyalkanoate) depolymerase family esterase